MVRSLKSRQRRSTRRPFCYRPNLEALEERLPPGDTLGWLMGWNWLTAGPTAESVLPAADRPGQSPPQSNDSLTAASDGPLLAPRLDPLSVPSPVESAGVNVTGLNLSGLSTPREQADDLIRAAVVASAAPPAPFGAGMPHDRVGPALVAQGLTATSGLAGRRPGADGGDPAGAARNVFSSDRLWFAALTSPVGEPAPPSPLPVSAPPAPAAAIHARFDLDTLSAAAFPSDRWTVPDDSQLTGLRINLPLPDPVARRSDFEDVQVLNTLDGFNLQPRLSIPFDGPIDPHSVNSQNVFLVSLGSTTGEGGDPFGKVIGIDQVVWDPASNTLFVESDELLAQHARYLLVVMRGVQGADGKPVEAGPAFQDLLAGRFDPSEPLEQLAYQARLWSDLHLADLIGVVPRSEVVTASVFTTQSATAVLEKFRDQIKAATPAPADFLLGPDGQRTVFALSDVAGITFNQQTQVAGPLNSVNLAVGQLRIIPGVVGQVAFGKYVSPDYVVHPGEFIPPVGTRTGTPEVQASNEIHFNLFLPSGVKPAGGWPVAIFGVANTGNKNVSPLQVAASMAAQGIATIAINPVGHGFGPLSTLTVRESDGTAVTFSAGGRGIDQDGNGTIGNNEGLRAASPRSILFFRDSIRQTVADLMQLTRIIEVGMDVDGDASPDLDSSRIYSFGQSLAGNYGTVFLAVEPAVKAGAFTAVGNPIANRQLGPDGRSVIGGLLNSRRPSLLNSPGVALIGGVSVDGPRFHENMPLRDGTPLTVGLANGTTHVIQSPVTNTVPGAIAIQEVLENFEWASQAGSPVAYAPHLRKAPLAGVPVKPVVYLLATGDQSAPNPHTTAVLRAGELADRAVLYRHDLAFAEIPGLPIDPHPFLVSVGNLAWREIVLGVQRQIAAFFASDGTVVIHPEPNRFFEAPIQGALPEDLNYIA